MKEYVNKSCFHYFIYVPSSLIYYHIIKQILNNTNMERETARLLKNTAIWMILVLITGGSIGLTERFFGKPASLIVGASILSGFMYWDFLKRKSAEDTTRQIFELLKANRDNSSINSSLKNKSTNFKLQTSAANYQFSISPNKCHSLFRINFILKSDPNKRGAAQNLERDTIIHH